MPPEQPRAAPPDSPGSLSKLGFGCSSFWARPEFSADRARAILDLAADRGVTYFDTGPSYAQGEERLGAFLAARGAAGLTVSTKVGTERGGARSFSPERMRASLDASLVRLGLARVDILYLHGPQIGDLEGAVAFLLDEKRAGRIGRAGINSFDPAVVAQAVGLPIDIVMLQYNVADQRFETLIEALARSGKTVVTGTALAQGIYDLRGFVPTNRRSAWYLMRAMYRDPRFVWRGQRLRRRLLRADPDAHAAALRFVTSHPLIASSVFNSTNPDHVRANIAAAARPMAPADRASLLLRQPIG